MTASEANELSITELKKYLLANWFDGDDSSKYCNGGDEETMVMHRLVQICEKYEKGLIIELPVPIGSIVYNIEFGEIEPLPLTYETITYVSEGWGKTIFATRKEAEARLRELRGDG